MGTIFVTKENNMRWVKQKLREWIFTDEVETATPAIRGNGLRKGRALGISTHDIADNEDGINITVRTAVGGRIVTFRQYDSRADRHNYRTYVVPEDLDFERELGKMITLETMRG